MYTDPNHNFMGDMGLKGVFRTEDEEEAYPDGFTIQAVPYFPADASDIFNKFMRIVLGGSPLQLRGSISADLQQWEVGVTLESIKLSGSVTLDHVGIGVGTLRKLTSTGNVQAAKSPPTFAMALSSGLTLKVGSNKLQFVASAAFVVTFFAPMIELCYAMCNVQLIDSIDRSIIHSLIH